MQARSPAQSLRERMREIALTALLLIVEAGLLALAGTSWWAPILLVSVVPLYVLSTTTLLGGLLDPVSLRRGIEGEQRVAELLAELEPNGYRAIHDLDIGRGNADHVLVGPAGVFVIETKDWGGRFYPVHGRLMFNERAANEVVGQVRAAAVAVSRRLEHAGIEARVLPLIVSTRASVHRSPLRIGAVTAVEADGLAAFVRRRPASMDAEAVSKALSAIVDHGLV
jgi:nuclease-like protein